MTKYVLYQNKEGRFTPPLKSKSLTIKRISKWGIVSLVAFLFFAASPLKAGITWFTGLQVIDVDLCGKFAHLQAYSENGPQEGRLDITLEVNAGTKANPNWQIVQQDSYSNLEGQYDFFIDGNSIALPIGNREYRVFFEFWVSDTDPMGFWNGEYLTGYSEQDVWVHFLYYPTPPELYVNELTDAAGPYLVANCGTAVYDLIFNYDFEAEY
ncbi:MAG: hypothetical protein LAT76_09500, partial [Schleiferiaceae bacterium]|nr:hypothetical protein [Schleiferiaceae bacterium]